MEAIFSQIGGALTITYPSRLVQLITSQTTGELAGQAGAALDFDVTSSDLVTYDALRRDIYHYNPEYTSDGGRGYVQTSRGMWLPDPNAKPILLQEIYRQTALQGSR